MCRKTRQEEGKETEKTFKACEEEPLRRPEGGRGADPLPELNESGRKRIRLGVLARVNRVRRQQTSSLQELLRAIWPIKAGQGSAACRKMLSGAQLALESPPSGCTWLNGAGGSVTRVNRPSMVAPDRPSRAQLAFLTFALFIH